MYCTCKRNNKDSIWETVKDLTFYMTVLSSVDSTDDIVPKIHRLYEHPWTKVQMKLQVETDRELIEALEATP